MTISKTKFRQITDTIIQKLEGGYFNPQWHDANSVYSTSGETMFGIDRKNAGTIDDNKFGIEFWRTIDSNKSKSKWVWNYDGGILKNKLSSLVSDMMLLEYNRLANLYLKPDTRKAVESDNRLSLHMSYAAWNGSGWFRKFANDLNTAFSKGLISPEQLTAVAVNSRQNEGLTKGSKPNQIIAKAVPVILSQTNEKIKPSNNKEGIIFTSIIFFIILIILYKIT